MESIINGLRTIKMLALAKEYGKIIDLCNELIGEIEEAANQSRLNLPPPSKPWHVGKDNDQNE